MADLKEVFPVLADDATGAGVAAISRTEGQAAAGKSGLIGFAFKDSSGNVVLPQLDASGALPIAFMPEAELYAYGTSAGSTSPVDLATIVAALSKKYHEFKVSVSSFREAVFTLVYIDDVGGTPVETVLGVWRVGPGQYSLAAEIPAYKDTTAGTGVQNFVLRGFNLDHASTMNASLACKAEN